jgi:hypothetical protein
MRTLRVEALVAAADEYFFTSTLYLHRHRQKQCHHFGHLPIQPYPTENIAQGTENDVTSGSAYRSLSDRVYRTRNGEDITLGTGLSTL